MKSDLKKSIFHNFPTNNKDPINNDYIKTIKNNIYNITSDKNVIAIINDAAHNINKIVTHAYEFNLAYLSYLFQNELPFPPIDKQYFSDIFKVVTRRKNKKGSRPITGNMILYTKFYEEHYSKTIYNGEIIWYDKMPFILAYEAIDMITNVENNIIEHFLQHLGKFVNVSFDYKGLSKKITNDYPDKLIRKAKHQELNMEFRNIKNDLLSFSDDLVSDPKYHDWIKLNRKGIRPNKTAYLNDNVAYDIKVCPIDYLRPMFYIANQMELLNDKIILENETRDDNMKLRQIKLFKVVPTRTNIIPKHITIDTCGLNALFLGPVTEVYYDYKNDFNQICYWNLIFDIGKKTFKKNKYVFNYMIRTDGVSVSIIFVRADMMGNPVKQGTIQQAEDNIEYIEHVHFTTEMKSKKIVVADPNYGNLIYCASRDINNKLKTFRYTQNQRRVETKGKKYNRIIRTLNRETIVDNQTVEQIQSGLSIYNGKTIRFQKVMEYITIKNKVNIQLANHYQTRLFRKLKLNKYINTQKSETKMIKNFTKKFGGPDEVLFILGDFDKGGHNMSGKEPAICKKIRRIFQNNHFKTYLINEFRTSMLCNGCHELLENFHKRRSQKPKDKGKIITVHGLLRHPDVNAHCKIIHNRDKNAVQNMLYIVETVKATGQRPLLYSRQSTTADESSAANPFIPLS
jgi:hypothetical protein